ncbi:hypothetical protein J3R30DRAFT_3480417, partial [Lentinula aciculospora]
MVNSFFHTIYTFFAYIYTLLFKSPQQSYLNSISPFPIDLECGSDLREATQGWNFLLMISLLQITFRHPNRLGLSFVLVPPPSASNSPCPTVPPSLDFRCSGLQERHFPPCDPTDSSAEIQETSIPQTCPSGSPRALPPPQMPFPPLQRFVFPAYASFCSNKSSHSIRSVAASPVKTLTERPSSTYSASSTNSDVRSQSSSGCSSQTCATLSVKKKTHRKQSPIFWYKDVLTLGPSSSLSSMQSTYLRRHRSIHRRSFQSIKHDPSMSYKHYSARSSRHIRQSTLPAPSRPLSEDPVSIVRKVFIECGSEVDTEGGGARARLMNRQTARSFGGMEIVDEEEEEEEKEQSFSVDSYILETSQDHSSASCYSTPDSNGPPTPATYCSPPMPEIIAPMLETKHPDFLVPTSKSKTQLPYLQDTCFPGLGLEQPSSDSLSNKLQDRPLSYRVSSLYADQRVSVVTWSDLVSFSSYGLSMLDDGGQTENEEVEDSYAIYEKDSEEDRSLERFNDNDDLVNNPLEDSGADLAAVLDSMSILVDLGLDARLLLSPPRQFCSTFA